MAKTTLQPRDSDVLYYPSEEPDPMGQTGIHFLFISLILDYLRNILLGRKDFYLISDQFLYYVEGDLTSVLAPDVALYFGVAGHPRRVWKTWEEGGKVPDLAFEVLSDSSAADLGSKRGTYASLGVREYVVFDPDGELVPERVRVYSLVDGELERVRPRGARCWLETVSLWIGVDDGLPKAWRADGTPVAHFEALAETLREREGELEASQAELEASQAELETSQAELEARGREIEALKARLAELERGR